MKNIILVLVLVLFTSSCVQSRHRTIQSVEDGRITAITDIHNLSKVKDTIVVAYHKTGMPKYRFYGKYVGKLPSPTRLATYKKFVVIKK